MSVIMITQMAGSVK